MPTHDVVAFAHPFVDGDTGHHHHKFAQPITGIEIEHTAQIDIGLARAGLHLEGIVWKSRPSCAIGKNIQHLPVFPLQPVGLIDAVEIVGALHGQQIVEQEAAVEFLEFREIADNAIIGGAGVARRDDIGAQGKGGGILARQAIQRVADTADGIELMLLV